MLDYKLAISTAGDGAAIAEFGNMSTQQIMMSRTEEGNVCRF